MLIHSRRPSARSLPALFCGALLLCLGLLSVPAAHAAEGSGAEKASWAVQPGGANGGAARSQFVYTLRPGAVLRDYVTVLNTGRKPVVLDLYTVDAFNIPDDGAFALRNPEEPKTGVGGWVRLGKQSRFNLPRGKGVRIPFEIAVPENAEPGDHAGAIVAANAKLESGNKKGDVTFDVRRRVGARIYLRVEGALNPSLAVSEFSAKASAPLVPYVTGDGDLAIDWSITNTGNARLDPEAAIELVGPFGGVVDEVAVEVPELLPGGVLTGTTELDALPPYGKLSARMAVTAEDADAEVSRTVWSVPWLPLGLVVLLASGWWVRRRYRGARWPFGSRAHTVEVPDREPEPIAVQ